MIFFLKKQLLDIYIKKQNENINLNVYFINPKKLEM